MIRFRYGNIERGRRDAGADPFAQTLT